jgi:DNA-binding transcriptional regulator YiaG
MRAYRHELKLSVRQFAELHEVSEEVVIEWEKNSPTPEKITLQKVVSQVRLSWKKFQE